MAPKANNGWRSTAIISGAHDSKYSTTTGLTSKQLTPHTLRRSVATVVTRGLGLEHASELLGHSDSRITRSAYVAPETKFVSADSVDQLFGFGEDLVT